MSFIAWAHMLADTSNMLNLLKGDSQKPLNAVLHLFHLAGEA